MVKKYLEYFMKKNYKRLNQKEFRIEEVIKKKCDKLYVKWKGQDSSFNSSIDKNRLEWMEFHCIKISQSFPKPYEPFGRDVNFKVDLFNRATKSDVKNISNIDTSRFALKSTLASFKTEVDK